MATFYSLFGSAINRTGGAAIEPREGLWFAEPRPIRRTLRKMPDWYVYFWAVPLLYRIFGRALGTSTPSWFSMVEAAGWLLLFILILWWGVAEMFATRRTRADRRFSDAPPGIREFTLEVVILRHDKEVGMDRGVAWFEGGLFYFTGTATSFVLSSADLHRPRYQTFRLDLDGRCKHRIQLRKAGASAELRLLPIRGWNRVQFWRRFGRFLSEPPDRTAVRQWPPLLAFEAESVSLASRSPEEIGAGAAREGSATGVVRT